ncbi:hypothetical protein UCREL1_6744 [Eutypa lata UCREL1]|uniref:Uncharacterized protein n=1 Tax=Eutypa lata (strain UCR-EL1) TaxID=1287681 RepID=M7T8W1_EUTLA|nr:hypothetical protein UCREL1_6744 [Eutypa lata UCREL1]
MGLPLFVAPVESDITSKPSAKTPADPAHARSPIRRAPRSPYHHNERRRQLQETREHRLRLLAALQDHDDTPPPPLIPSSSRSSGGGGDGGADRTSFSDLVRPQEELDNLIRERRRLRRWGRREEAQAQADRAHHALGRRIWDGVLISSRLIRLQKDQRMPHWVQSRPSPLARESEGYRSPIPPLPRRIERPSARQPSHYIRHGQRVRYVDGLGDRDRSLSPEGDGVWDTLQSTLTPDPQPPSVGSSFASTNASAAASQSTIANSSVNTSVTSPDEEAEEPPCDHDFEEEGEGESEDDRDDRGVLRRTTEPSRRPTPHGSGSRSVGGRRSYADVAALIFDTTTSSPRDEGNDRPEWLSGMHRIVRGLASRQDIPDEWWAEAGLSRSMRYEDSN